MKSTEDHFFCYMVDPFERIIQHIQLSNKHWFQEMKQLGNYKMLERHHVLNAPHCEWWGDEEGRLKEKTCYFSFTTNENLINDVISPHNPNKLAFMKKEDIEHRIKVNTNVFCGISFFTGNTVNEFRPQSVQLRLGEFANCIEFYREDWKPDEAVDFKIVHHTN